MWSIPRDLRAAVPAGAAGTRLRAIADEIPVGSGVVADVGADHGRLGAALLAEGRVRRVIAVDRSFRAASGARRTLSDSVRTGRAAVVVADGLDAIGPGSVDVLVVAGLGGPSTAEVVSRARAHRPAEPAVVVVQAQTRHADLHLALTQCGLRAQSIRVVCEGRRLYLLARFVHEEAEDNGCRSTEELLESNPVQCSGTLRLWRRIRARADSLRR